MVTVHPMPRLVGSELIKKVRATGMPLQVIMACGQQSMEDLEIEAFLLKPYTAEQLVETVERILKSSVLPDLRSPA